MRRHYQIGYWRVCVNVFGAIALFGRAHVHTNWGISPVGSSFPHAAPTVLPSTPNSAPVSRLTGCFGVEMPEAWGFYALMGDEVPVLDRVCPVGYRDKMEFHFRKHQIEQQPG